MSDQFVFIAEGMADISARMREMENVPLKASMALNDALAWARTQAKDLMLKEVDWPSSYLNPGEKRLTIAEYASPDNLRGVIKGTDRPTSLARFVRGGNGTKNSPLSVSVGRGKPSVRLPGAFLMRLRSGNTGALGNQGLAMRTKNGQAPHAAWRPKQIGKNLYLLYGPSVDQVFRQVLDRDTAFAEKVTVHLDAEFRRLLGVNL